MPSLVVFKNLHNGTDATKPFHVMPSFGLQRMRILSLFQLYWHDFCTRVSCYRHSSFIHKCCCRYYIHFHSCPPVSSELPTHLWNIRPHFVVKLFKTGVGHLLMSIIVIHCSFANLAGSSRVHQVLMKRFLKVTAYCQGRGSAARPSSVGKNNYIQPHQGCLNHYRCHSSSSNVARIQTIVHNCCTPVIENTWRHR